MHNWHQLCYQDMLQTDNRFQKLSEKMTYLKRHEKKAKTRLMPVSDDHKWKLKDPSVLSEERRGKYSFPGLCSIYQ